MPAPQITAKTHLDNTIQDSAFEPRSSFDFADELNNIEHDMASFHGFQGDSMELGLPGALYGDNELNQEFFGGSNDAFPGGSNAFAQGQYMPNSGMHSVPEQFGFGVPGVPSPRSAQSDIVNSRSDQVRQHFGQITPPDEDLPKSRTRSSKQLGDPQPKEEDNGKLTKEQRARNAANHRHHKSKKSKKDADLEDISEDGNGGSKSSKSITIQREKNRVAAAKCRAKKKAGNEVRQEDARQKAAENNYLTRQARELRDERSRLRSLILAHNPEVCGCHDIHQFNMREAQKLVLGAGNFNQSISSPSQDSISPIRSPESDGSLRGSLSGSAPSRHQSFSQPYTTSHGISLENLHPANPLDANRQQLPQEFADFLHSSPGGRAGFS